MKKKNNILILLSLIWLITNAADCGGGDRPVPITCNEENTVKLPQELIDRFYFNEGSYWVYQNINSSTIDSSWISRAYNNIHVEPELGRNCIQVAGCTIYSTFQDTWSFGLDNTNASAEDTYEKILFNIYFSNADKNQTVFRFNYQNSEYQNPTEEGGIIEFLDSIIINNRTFYNVLHLYYPTTTVNSEIYKEAYYAKDYGLVKYKTWDETIWEVKRLNIIK